MENFVLGFFQEQLSKFIVGFRKEQVNANLLNGKGEITDVSLNCAALNDVLATVTPLVELESVSISQLGFHVTSWSNLKKAPIVIDVGDVNVVIVEPLHYLKSGERKEIQQISTSELDRLVQSGVRNAFLRGPYNLFDRIMDNLALEIKSIHVSFQPRGKFKTRRTGPWTPPKLVATLKRVKFVGVNEYGQEADPEEVWQHNRHHPKNQPHHERTFTIYKKLSMECTASLQPPTETLPPLVKDGQVEIHFALLKRLRDAAILAVQVDATLSNIEVKVEESMVPHLAHAVAGFQYCFAKDRAFEDPLLGDSSAPAEVAESVETSLSTSCRNIQVDDGSSGQSSSVNVKGGSTPVSEDVEAEGDISSSDDDDYEEDVQASSQQMAQQQRPTGAANPARTPYTSTPSRGDRPVLLLPNGMVIYQKLSLSLSIHHLSVRGIYNEQANGHVQLDVRGLVAELMWPKTTGEKGAYGQVSLSYVSVQERHGKRSRSILVGGVHDDINLGPLENSAGAFTESMGDINFPLFESRSIREDPLGLRHSFPAQAFGLKTTVDFLPSPSGDKDDIMVLHEVGMDRFAAVVDSEAWSRALMFLLNKDGGGFDPRWHSGDWVDVLTAEMLVHPSQNFVFDDHIQPMKEIFLDENHLISSDLFNVTARLSNMELRIPAAIEEDVRSCDFIMSVSESMLLVSSALPRTFLNGKLGKKSTSKEGGTLIAFPNDPSDICYSMEEKEDPSIRQTGSDIARTVSTFRLQLTVRGHSVRISPVIPFCDGAKPQQLLSPEDITLMACFEGEPPDDSLGANQTKLALFTSILIQQAEVDCDFDLLAGAICTVRHHVTVIRDALDSLRQAGILPEAAPQAPSESKRLERIKSDINGRRVSVRRQLQKSRKAGGLNITFCVQLNQFSFHLWRQHVPQTSQFRTALEGDADFLAEDSPLPIVNLFEFQTKELELGLDFQYTKEMRRIVWKCCVSEVVLKACDFGAECTAHRRKSVAARSTPQENGETDVMNTEPMMVELISLKEDSSLEGMNSATSRSSEKSDISIRVEEQLTASRSISFASEISTGGAVDLRKVDEIECLILLLLESLLLPAGNAHRHQEHHSRDHLIFPPGSVGALFITLIKKLISALRTVKRGIEDSNVSNSGSNIGGIARWLQQFVKKLLPKDTGAALLRISTRDLAFFIPRVRHNKASNGEARSYCLLLDEATFATGFISSALGDSESGIMQVLANREKKWLDVLGGSEEGFHVTVQSCQSLHSLSSEGATKTVEASLLPRFESTFSFRPSGVSASTGNTILSVDGTEKLREIYVSFSAFSSRWVRAGVRLFRVLSSLVSNDVKIPNKTIKLPGNHEGNTELSPFDEACVDVSTSVRACRSLLCSIRKSLTCLEMEKLTSLREKQCEVDRLRCVVFCKERERVAALALTASQAMGWIRTGGTHQSGQRTSTVTSMWRQWAILRRSLLVLFKSPGAEAVDFVSLKGARLCPLEGGRSKRDVKLGFALVESGGLTRFFIVPTVTEYEIWISELRSAIDFYSSPRMAEDSTSSMVQQEPVIETPLSDAQAGGRSDEQVVSRHGSQSATYGTSYLPDVPESLAVSGEHHLVKASEFGLSDTDGLQPNDQKGKRIRQKLAGTKAKLGSAVQAAKQNVKAASEKQRLRRSQGGDDDISVASDNLCEANNNQDKQSNFVAQEGVSSVDQQAEDFSGSPRRGKMFRQRFVGTKARLGSAVQSTRQNLKAAAEKQRRYRTSSEDISVGSTDDMIHHGESSTPFPAHVVPSDVFTQHPGTEDADSRSQEVPASIAETADSAVLKEEHIDTTELMVSTDDIDEDQEGSQGTGVSSNDMSNDDVLNSVNNVRRRGQIRKSVTRIGAAVKATRSNGGPNDNKGRFNLRRFSKSSSGSFGGDGRDSIKMRSLHAGSGSVDADIDRESQWQEIPLTKIEGHWIVLVEYPNSIETPEDVSSSVSDNDKMRSAGLVGEGDPTPESLPVTEEKDDEDAEKDLPASSLESQTIAKTSVDKGEQILAPVSQSASDTMGNPILQSFRIRVVCAKLPEGAIENRATPTSVERNLSDILALHTVVSESIVRVGPPAIDVTDSFNSESREVTSNSVAERLGLSPWDNVRLTGSMLESILRAPSTLDEFEKIRKYLCEILAEFINSTLACPLPLDAQESLKEFLGIEEAVVKTVESSEPLDEWDNGSMKEKEQKSKSTTEDILSISAACEAELVRAESRGLVARKLAESVTAVTTNATIEKSDLPLHGLSSKAAEPLLPPSIANALHASMHQALMKAMAERDEAHAQLVSNRVLHAHELEQERKKVDRLSKKFELLKSEAPVGGASFFLGGDEIAALEKERMRSYEKQLSQNSDAELISLCQQLASEISQRTEAALEIIRLKESREIERASDLAERDALKNELQKYKEMLAEEQTKTEEAQQEAAKWKAYHTDMSKEEHK